jgi:hypothetical protein
MLTDPSPRRRWFTFSLRTLLVVMTAFCVWMGYHLNWIRQRHAFLSEQSAVLAPHLDGLTNGEKSGYCLAPGCLWLFGENGRNSVLVSTNSETPHQIAPDDLERLREARRLFPEASPHMVAVRDGSHWMPAD